MTLSLNPAMKERQRMQINIIRKIFIGILLLLTVLILAYWDFNDFVEASRQARLDL